MNQLVPLRSSALPELVAAAGERASMRFLEFFVANIRSPHTRQGQLHCRRRSWPRLSLPKHGHPVAGDGRSAALFLGCPFSSTR
jgi:hypothetical protein